MRTEWGVVYKRPIEEWRETEEKIDEEGFKNFLENKESYNFDSNVPSSKSKYVIWCQIEDHLENTWIELKL